MCLYSLDLIFRPNRRVNVRASYLEFNERAQDEKEDEDEVLDDILSDFDDDETLDFVPESQEKGDAEDIQHRHKKETSKRKRATASSKTLTKLQKRKRIKQKIQKPLEKQDWNTTINYKLLKDSVCACCSKEIERGKAESSKDLFTDKTEAGSNLYDIFVSIINKEDVSQTDYGRRLCRKCCLALDQIEFYYMETRALVDGLRDTFMLGQKNLDTDLGGSTNTEVESELASVLQTMDMCKNAVFKVLDNNCLQSFNPQGIGIADFHCR